MPRVPAFATETVRDLLDQLRYAPALTRRRQMDAAERLVAEIDPRLAYPADFVVFKVTGYRPEGDAAAGAVPGEALRRDLVTLVQHLSRTVDLPRDHDGRNGLELAEVRRRLNVSNKTLQRYRREGLVCHYALDEGGEKRLICFDDALERFIDVHRGRVIRAGRFSRIDDATRRRMIDRARQLRGERGLSLSKAARQMAGEFGRSHEAVRGVLLRHDRRADAPIFGEPGPLGPRDRRLLLRARRWGIPASELARRFGKTPAAVHRAVCRRRSDLLRLLDLRWVELPTFSIPEAEAVILAAPAVTGGLLDDDVDRDVLTLLAAARAARAPDEREEAAIVAAFNLLKRRAALAIDDLPEYPAAAVLDPIETDLRWAALLLRRLVSMALPAALRVLEQAAHRRLLELPSEEVLAGVDLALRTAVSTAERVDPHRGQRIERMTAFAMDRALARAGGPPLRQRAAARHEPASITLPPGRLRFAPWQHWLDPRADLHRHLERLPPELRTAVELRFGLTGAPPMTIEALAARLGCSPAAAARRVERAAQKRRAP